jgi:ribosomal protein S6
MVFSDGEENASKYWNSSKLAERIQELQKTDRWTFTYVGANQDLSKISQTLKIDSSNIYKDWNTTETASTEMMNRRSKEGLIRYMSLRSCGKTSVSNFYDPSSK